MAERQVVTVMASQPHPQNVVFPRGELASARLSFESGAAPKLDVRGAPLGADLARLSFGEPAPRVELRGDEIVVDYRGFFRWFFLGRPAPGTIELNHDIPWTIDVQGGVARVELDLRTVDLKRFDVTGGAAQVELRLGRPTGIVQVRLNGGAANLRITHPPGVGARLRISGGAAHVELDDKALGAVGGGLTLVNREWAEKGDCYDIKIRGGAASLTVEPEGSA